eukprot:TRINITY_DN7703_c0_g1_i1.p1 TRINITY_DN7703_c0_g1~~TRINITY_DN7703_c0_g1_i1.p1  ORF type:complete len:463 (+),score=134.49 TRINITY_DN7703_c0_g1_i1:73-1461(+)
MAVDLKKICIAEFVGTFLLVLTVGCNVLSENTIWGAVSIACVLMVSIYCFAQVSGAHLNPAVTATLALAGKLPEGTSKGLLVGAYCGAQVAGALLATACYYGMWDHGFPLKPKPGQAFGALICEFVYTLLLCFVVLNVAASKAKPPLKNGQNQYYGLAIGFVIIAGGYASAPVGAGCFNPAVVLSIYVGGEFHGSAWLVMYTCVELLGAATAWKLWGLVRPEETSTISDPPREYSLQSKLIAEALGTFMLTFTVGNNVLGGSKATAFSIGAALTCMICAVGDVSGGHFNPAVTLAVHSAKADPAKTKEPYYYFAAQLGGAALAGICYAIVHKGFTFPLGPGIGHNWLHVAVGEFMFTFVLTTTVLCVCLKEAAKEYEGFIVGSCVTAGGFALSSISGGALNPAVAAGIAFVHIIGGGLFWKALVYGLVQLSAAASSAYIYNHCYPLEKGENELIVSKDAAVA